MDAGPARVAPGSDRRDQRGVGTPNPGRIDRQTFPPSYRFLVFRGILEYNSFRQQLLTDVLALFTYIPGTVIHAGYGSLHEKTRWDGERYVPGHSLAESGRGLFFKASYLWRR